MPCSCPTIESHTIISIPSQIQIVERLTRYWIVFQHHLNDNADFVRDDGKQNTEQLTNTLVPLKENYAYAHMLGQHGLCVHEPEFHAYSVLLTGDIKQATKGHAGVSHSPEVGGCWVGWAVHLISLQTHARVSPVDLLIIFSPSQQLITGAPRPRRAGLRGDGQLRALLPPPPPRPLHLRLPHGQVRRPHAHRRGGDHGADLQLGEGAGDAAARAESSGGAVPAGRGGAGGVCGRPPAPPAGGAGQPRGRGAPGRGGRGGAAAAIPCGDGVRGVSIFVCFSFPSFWTSRRASQHTQQSHRPFPPIQPPPAPTAATRMPTRRSAGCRPARPARP